MKVTIAAVISLDGKITKHNDPDLHSWVSTEDQEHFARLLNSSDAVIFGRSTYDRMRGEITHREGFLRLVLTSKPEKYATDVVAGKLEFIKATPDSVLDYLEKLGKKNILIAGGEQIMTDFLDADVVDELFITIEPRIFASGISIVKDKNLNTKLQLITLDKINKQGTVLLHYKVI